MELQAQPHFPPSDPYTRGDTPLPRISFTRSRLAQLPIFGFRTALSAFPYPRTNTLLPCRDTGVSTFTPSNLTRLGSGKKIRHLTFDKNIICKSSSPHVLDDYGPLTDSQAPRIPKWVIRAKNGAHQKEINIVDTQRAAIQHVVA